MQDEELIRVDIYSALNKPNLMFGADRELILSNALIAFALIFVGLTLMTTIIGIILIVVNGFFLRAMAKADPLMRKVYMRQIKYQKFYSAKSTPFAFMENK